MCADTFDYYAEAAQGSFRLLALGFKGLGFRVQGLGLKGSSLP